jgi:hypothetical protein
MWHYKNNKCIILNAIQNKLKKVVDYIFNNIIDKVDLSVLNNIYDNKSLIYIWHYVMNEKE